MNRFKEALDELRNRPDAKDLAKLLPTFPDRVDTKGVSADDEPEFHLPYSSDPVSTVEPWD